jgi:hypothetical protein
MRGNLCRIGTAGFRTYIATADEGVLEWDWKHKAARVVTAVHRDMDTPEKHPTIYIPL